MGMLNAMTVRINEPYNLLKEIFAIVQDELLDRNPSRDRLAKSIVDRGDRRASQALCRRYASAHGPKEEVDSLPVEQRGDDAPHLGIGQNNVMCVDVSRQKACTLRLRL